MLTTVVNEILIGKKDFFSKGSCPNENKKEQTNTGKRNVDKRCEEYEEHMAKNGKVNNNPPIFFRYIQK